MIKQRLKKGEQRKINWDNLVKDLLENCEHYHSQFYTNKKFSGPSHHFHLRALTAIDKEKAEMTYAMLVSWGMHRMGGGAQMNDYKIFEESIFSTLQEIESLKEKKLSEISKEDMQQLEQIFDNLNPMRSSKKIVAVSKVLAHYLPDIIAPIDNEYTFQFICEKPRQTNFPLNWTEFELFKEIHIKLFKPVVSDGKFISSAKNWLNDSQFHWDTSLPKIVDNLIVGKIGHLKRTDDNYKRKKPISILE
ncbi:hypothetical protein [Polluticaenibacter yanchengensis]|uniref:Uncharacterized protein n=1 Tax=Polluticaenibacter yanchengensis TaxID=3014562 RepID=A0ABT4UFZ7_9BACT|nr:hypothetical protein [Chitinophagaceae bacterium LY-5]